MGFAKSTGGTISRSGSSIFKKFVDEGLTLNDIKILDPCPSLDMVPPVKVRHATQHETHKSATRI